MANTRTRTTTFTVPAGAGSYAPEVCYLNRQNMAATGVAFDEVVEVQNVIAALPASAAIEIDLLKPNGDPTQSGDWLTALVVQSSTGLQSILALARWIGVRIRAKSGGTGGTATLHTEWW